MPRPWTAFAVLSLFLLVVGPVRPVPAAVHEVSVQNFQFVPKTLDIVEGDVVRWVWAEGVHTTTNGASPTAPGAGTIWDAPVDVSNQTFERTFTAAGSFPYHCSFHFAGGMTGTINVSDGNLPPVLANPGTQDGQEEVFFTVTLTATDGNGDPLTLVDNGTTPSWATFVDNGDGTATLSGIPALGDAATYPVSVTASDGTLSDTEGFDVVIAAAPIEVVTLTSSGFSPSTVTIDPGFQIRWIKDAGGNHTTTNGTGPGDPQAGTIWDAELRASSPEFTFQFDNAGTYPYFCANHPTETGTIEVEAVVGIPDLEGLPIRGFSARPNPFPHTIFLSFELEQETRVVIEVFSVTGQRVRLLHEGVLPAGSKGIAWDGRDDGGRFLPAGVYFARFEVNGRSGAAKLLKAR